ncbi:MAG: EamA family transporter [Rhodobacterales bacterium]|nr:EamA family transporter [Rhodobacterales bacterium]
MTVALFITSVLAWGLTWIAIKLHLDAAPIMVSLCYRFVIAAVVLALVLAATGRLRPMAWRHQPWLVLQGVALFGANYVLVYNGSALVVSGLVALLFSSATLFNPVNAWIFFGQRPQPRVVAGAALGMAGIATLFRHDLMALDLGDGGALAGPLLGAALVLAGTYVFSLGNMVSMRNTREGLDLPNAVLWAMGYGAVIQAALAAARGLDFHFTVTPVTLGSLLYLALPGTIVGFLAYLSLVQRVGAGRAAYVTVLYPVVALVVSVLVEGYAWTLESTLGLALVMAGNLVIFGRLPRHRTPA